MASNNDDMEGGVAFKWTEEYEKIFSELCIKFIRKNGRVSFKWKEISQEFEAITKRRCIYRILKNKYDSMKRDWRIWKFLKFGETGLGWDHPTGKLSCSYEWWDRKIKEKPEAKKFRNKSIDPLLEELWNQLFEDNYASGVDVTTPSIDPNSIQSVEREDVNVEEEDKESGGEDMHHYECDGDYVYSEYKRYASRVDELLNEKRPFCPDLVDEFDGPQVPGQGDHTNKTAQTQKVVKKPVNAKHKRRQSGGAAKLSSQIDALVSNSNMAMEILHSGDNASKHGSASSTIAVAFAIIDRIVTECWLEKGSELWCFTVSLIGNEVNREIFMNIDGDGFRKDWLMYMRTKEK